MIVAFALLSLAIGFVWGRWHRASYWRGFRDAHTICHGGGPWYDRETRCHPSSCECERLERDEDRPRPVSV